MDRTTVPWSGLLSTDSDTILLTALEILPIIYLMFFALFTCYKDKWDLRAD